MNLLEAASERKTIDLTMTNCVNLDNEWNPIEAEWEMNNTSALTIKFHEFDEREKRRKLFAVISITRLDKVPFAVAE